MKPFSLLLICLVCVIAAGLTGCYSGKMPVQVPPQPSGEDPADPDVAEPAEKSDAADPETTPTPSEDSTMTFALTSTAFAEGEPIPKKYTDDGEDVSPPLAWTGVPEGATELVLICDDPDAPTAEPWVHWVIYNISADLSGLPEGVPAEEKPANVPGAIQGNNTWPTIGYRGPAPPSGTHRYYFKLYAVPAGLFSEPGLDKKAVLAAIEGKVLGETQLMGTYKR